MLWPAWYSVIPRPPPSSVRITLRDIYWQIVIHHLTTIYHSANKCAFGVVWCGSTIVQKRCCCAKDHNGAIVCLPRALIISILPRLWQKMGNNDQLQCVMMHNIPEKFLGCFPVIEIKVLIDNKCKVCSYTLRTPEQNFASMNTKI